MNIVNIVIVDDRTRKKLRNFSEPLDLCDRTGRVLARLTPRSGRVQYDVEPKISQEEIERRSRSKEKTYTTAEVLTHLRKLGKTARG